MVERYIRDHRVAGSNPVASIVMTKSGSTEFYRVLALFSFLFFVLDLAETGGTEKSLKNSSHISSQGLRRKPPTGNNR